MRLVCSSRSARNSRQRQRSLLVFSARLPALVLIYMSVPLTVSSVTRSRYWTRLSPLSSSAEPTAS
ncbi:hypothetical protein Bca52824_007065 [Brassica carinata]|uniref:Uncharacterized protein n=1 Tax=Brassica carinata TaxID=52824 RepID=A0A8X8B7J3_BRACI|nr:hypothetical protein Bca52824_007065 [Brassica carinata]